MTWVWRPACAAAFMQVPGQYSDFTLVLKLEVTCPVTALLASPHRASAFDYNRTRLFDRTKPHNQQARPLNLRLLERVIILQASRRQTMPHREWNGGVVLVTQMDEISLTHHMLQ